MTDDETDDQCDVDSELDEPVAHRNPPMYQVEVTRLKSPAGCQSSALLQNNENADIAERHTASTHSATRMWRRVGD